MSIPSHMINNSAPAEAGQAVTPSDSVNLSTPARCLYIGGAGNVSVEMMRGNTITFAAVPAGSFLPVNCRRVNATGTTASQILALY